MLGGDSMIFGTAVARSLRERLEILSLFFPDVLHHT